MQYYEFIDHVAQKAGLRRQTAEVATQAVLSVLGQRLSEKEAGDLASQLARPLKPMLENVPGHGHAYPPREFVLVVAERERTPLAEARVHTRAVLSTLREAVSRGELADVLAELWRDPEYEELWAEPATKPGRAAVGGGDELAQGHDRFLATVQRRAGLDPQTAELAIRATLTTLAERITRGEAEDLAGQLPVELRPWLQRTRPEAERFTGPEFVRRTGRRMAAPDEGQVERAVRAVLATLREAISEAELHDLFSQLPEDVLRLFSPRAA